MAQTEELEPEGIEEATREDEKVQEPEPGEQFTRRQRRFCERNVMLFNREIWGSDQDPAPPKPPPSPWPHEPDRDDDDEAPETPPTEPPPTPVQEPPPEERPKGPYTV